MSIVLQRSDDRKDLLIFDMHGELVDRVDQEQQIGYALLYQEGMIIFSNDLNQIIFYDLNLKKQVRVMQVQFQSLIQKFQIHKYGAIEVLLLEFEDGSFQLFDIDNEMAVSGVPSTEPEEIIKQQWVDRQMIQLLDKPYPQLERYINSNSRWVKAQT